MEPIFRAVRRLRLRARIVFAFVLGSALLAVMLAISTYSLTRSSTLRDREQAAADQFFTNATQVRQAVRSGNEEITEVLESLPRIFGARPIAYLGGAQPWLTLSLNPQEIPESMRERVLDSDGTEAYRMRYPDGGQTQLAFGWKLVPTGESYFEVVPLSDVEDNLRSLAFTLAGAGVLTAAAASVLGVWVGSRVLRPLGTISSAAEAITRGQLSTRLEEHDDPDLSALTSSFNEMASALQARIERDERFASDVSHELRSPLMTLRASVGVLDSRRDELSERSLTALNLLVADIERFERMVQDLLEIARSPTVLETEELVNLADLVTHAVRTAPNGSEVEIDIDSDAFSAMVLGDKRRLAQVVSNLLENAEKHGDGQIDVHLSATEDKVRMVVQDEGPGVPVQERELIFERFARGSAARRRRSGDGTGLGLALVAEHVRLHNGRVWVEDRPDGQSGARFVVELPTA
jgi:signal transduction histidine kinase